MNSFPFSNDIEIIPSSWHIYKSGDCVIRTHNFSLEKCLVGLKEFQLLSELGVNVIPQELVIGNGDFKPQVFQVVPYLPNIIPFHRNFDVWIEYDWIVPNDFIFEVTQYFLSIVNYFEHKLQVGGHFLGQLDLYHQVAYDPNARSGQKILLLDVDPYLADVTDQNIAETLGNLKFAMRTIERYFLKKTNTYISLREAEVRANKVIDLTYKRI